MAQTLLSKCNRTDRLAAVSVLPEASGPLDPREKNRHFNDLSLGHTSTSTIRSFTPGMCVYSRYFLQSVTNFGTFMT
ncbi:hypothetical protein EYF80_048690 [Liparis tanakae]|uniref:Uncharacterized protein n=1 Tax=Liparis tanakae TaxID=230148 RepID=A0A4Z2FIV4_9TELE|nr:hypothetical protein EYF80_048690 [Liparis tanakae]